MYKYSDVTASGLMNRSDEDLNTIHKEREFQKISDDAHRDAAASALRDADDNFNSAQAQAHESGQRFTEVSVVVDLRKALEATA